MSTRANREDTVLVLIDFQERLMPAMVNNDKVIESTGKLVDGAKEFDLPIIATQQYTKGMGPTVPELAAKLGDFEPVEKKEFSCWLNDDFKSALEKTGRKTVIIAGCETHVCVQQTVLDLLDADFEVIVAGDCVSSRKRYTRDTALALMAEAGATISAYESILFDLLITAADPHFKAISKIVK